MTTAAPAAAIAKVRAFCAGAGAGTGVDSDGLGVISAGGASDDGEDGDDDGGGANDGASRGIDGVINAGSVVFGTVAASDGSGGRGDIGVAGVLLASVLPTSAASFSSGERRGGAAAGTGCDADIDDG